MVRTPSPCRNSFPPLEPRNRLGSNTGGTKRARVETQQRQETRSQVSSKKTVVGTCGSSTNGRLMKSPPADIFVWGLHPETLPEDIVKDLGDSGINIEAKDVLKKSKDGAALLSFKVSVRAEDLQKALDPQIWPLRVKVREYVYYPKKKPNENASSSQLPNSSQPQVPGIAVQPPTPTGDAIAVSNRFNPLVEAGATPSQ